MAPHTLKKAIGSLLSISGLPIAFGISGHSIKIISDDEWHTLHSPMGVCIKYSESTDRYSTPNGGAWQIQNSGLKDTIGMGSGVVVEDLSTVEQDYWAYKIYRTKEGSNGEWTWWSSAGYCETVLAMGNS